MCSRKKLNKQLTHPGETWRAQGERRQVQRPQGPSSDLGPQGTAPAPLGHPLSSRLGGGRGAAGPMSKSAQVGAGEIAGRGAAKQPAWHKHAATSGIAGATYAAGLDLQLTKFAVQLVW